MTRILPCLVISNFVMPALYFTAVPLLCLFLLSQRALSQDFAYLANGDLFKYLNDPRPGLSLFPASSGDGSNSGQSRKDREKLKLSLEHDEITIEKALSNGVLILDAKNYLGFVHFCSVFARTRYEQDVIKWLNSLVSDDPKRNFSILYAAYVMRVYGRDEFRAKSQLKHLVSRFSAEHVPLAKTARYPNLVEYFRENFPDDFR